MTDDKPQATVTVPGVGFAGLLTVLFIGLKLTGYVDWSWIWVLSPLWLPAAILLVVVVIVFLAYLIGSALWGLVRK
jgi:uncharacterized protein (DUF983 family)